MTHSRDERLALAALLAEKGPDAPTLCEGWKTGDLAAHLVLRESRPDAAAGVMGGPLAGYTARAQRRLAQKMSYADLVEAFRTGPPRFSPFSLPRLDEAANTVEYFVHHEDVLRAGEGWTPRPLDPAMSDALWARLKSGARFFLGKAPVGIELVRTDTTSTDTTSTSATGADATGGDGATASAAPTSAGPTQSRVTAKRAAPLVTVAGTPADLTLWAFGRVSASHVSLDGPKAAIHKLQAWRR